jgi:hypothetical protein
MKNMLASLMVLGIACGASFAAPNPQVAAIREKIKVLRAEEKVVRKEIHAWYDSFIKGDKLTAEALRLERKALKKQEDALVAVAGSEEARTAIRKQYDAVRALLREDIKLDAATIRELRALEKTQQTAVGNVYKSAILILEEQAKLAAKKRR